MLPGRHSKYLRLAAELATLANGLQKHGCVIVSGGRILGKGWNDYRSHPNYVYPVNTVHAEDRALQANWESEFKGATAYIVRLTRRKILGMSRPCEKCLQRIKECGIKRIIYSTNNVNEPFAIEKV